MATASRSKASRFGDIEARSLDLTKAYRIEDPAGLLRSLDLPERSSLFIVPDDEAADAELRSGKAGVANVGRSVAADAYEPSASAKAVLRGISFGEADLKAAGGAFGVDEVRTLFRGISRQAVDKKVAEGYLLAVPGPGGRRRFPAMQFTADGSVVKGLKQVQSALGFSSPWSVLNFLVNDHDLLDDGKPIDALRRGDVGRVVEAAKRSGVQGT